MRSWMGLVVLVAGLLLAGCASESRGGTTGGRPMRLLEADEPALQPVAWLTGTWASAPDQHPATVEHWMHPDGGTMIGINRTVSGRRTVFYEYLRLEVGADGRLVYLASPLGRDPPTAFTLVEHSVGRLVFENPGHDYPQRIIYTLGEDGTLVQRIEGVEEGTARSSEWRVEKAES